MQGGLGCIELWKKNTFVNENSVLKVFDGEQTTWTSKSENKQILHTTLEVHLKCPLYVLFILKRAIERFVSRAETEKG